LREKDGKSYLRDRLSYLFYTKNRKKDASTYHLDSLSYQNDGMSYEKDAMTYLKDNLVIL